MLIKSKLRSLQRSFPKAAMRCFSGNAEQLANDADNNAAERTAAACSTVNTTVSTSSGTAEQPAVLAVNPKDAVADSPMLRRTFHTIIAMFQATHICDFYITKYLAKPMAQLQSLFSNISGGLRWLC